MIKRFLSILSLVLVFAFNSQAQNVQDIFGNTDYNVTWFGIDYSHAKIVGSLGLFGGKTPVSPADLRDRYYPAWNYLILDEPGKYDIAKMIHRQSVTKDISIVKQLNAAAHIDSIEASVTPYYTLQEIQQFISAYPIENKAGIGLVFIAESMNKASDDAYYHVVFFNMTTKEILLQERLRGAPVGFGIRNHWAGSYFSVMEYIKEDGYQKWRNQYGSSKPTKTPNSIPQW
ncbi:MAG TPA: hypothetical protein VK796_13475 [Cytophaga sp.]|nr:hypothetical protein [Cytophaga sp.]